MEILIVREPVSEDMLRNMADEWHGILVKGVADIERGTIALGGEWHMDANIVLLADGSQQENVWGFNLYPDEHGDAAIEYISLINIRPAQGNRAMELADETLRQKLRDVVRPWVPTLAL